MKLDIKSTLLAFPAALFITLTTTNVFAQNSSVHETVDQRLDRIEQQLGSSNWQKNLAFSGAIEVESTFSNRSGKNTSDITLSTVELGFESAITKSVTGHLLFLFEEGNTDPPQLDEGFINIQLGDSPLSITAGQFYLPFGTFSSNLISDPLTLELGEIRESAIQLNFAQAAFYSSFFIFNGTAKESGDKEKIGGYGAAAGLSHQGKEYTFDLNVMFLSNIADSDTLQDSVSDRRTMESAVAGAAVQVSFSMGSITLSGEYIGANRSFKAADLSFNKSGAQPSSSSFELAYNFKFIGRDTTVAVAIQTSDEAVALELPEQRTAATLSVNVAEHIAVAIELKHEEDYEKAMGGRGEDSNTGTLMLAVAF